MRGPETAQFGLALSLLAHYFHYTGDSRLLQKHGSKIEAMATVLLAMHDQSLNLAKDNPGYGLIYGWSEHRSRKRGGNPTSPTAHSRRAG